MKPIKLTEEHKSKLLEMCNDLFSGILDKSECYCNEDQGAGYSYSDEHGDCNVCKNTLFEFWDDSLHFTTEDGRITIHWFEFCMTHLQKKILKWGAEELGSEAIDGNIHLVDYLYKEFKKLEN